MKTHQNRGLSCLVLGALLFGAAGPGIAQERSFRVELDEALVEELSLDTEGLPALEREKPVRIAEAASTPIRHPDRLAQISANQNTASGSSSKVKRTGGWLKRHWWVPSLIGVAIGIVVLEPFDSNADDKAEAMNR